MKFNRNIWLSKGRAFLLFAAALSSPGAQPAGAKTGHLEGYYSSSSKQCTRYDKAKDDFVSCAKQFQDCVLIKGRAPGEIAVEIYSTQADQHVCAVSGPARMEKGVLTYRFGTEPDAQRIQFIETGNKIVLKHFARSGEAAENCGAHAGWDGLEFKKIHTDASKRVCFKDE